MKTEPMKRRNMGITLRTALLSWLVTIMTLLIFVTVIIPQQKRTFLENLESKAHGVAVSLRDVAAGAAVNEDFSSVADHCMQMLSGDQALDHLVIAKNDGFALIIERDGKRAVWRSEVAAGTDWRPDQRQVQSGIGVVPMLKRRVFHFAQPFDYSGIQWGWIHVGLSLDSYDRNVAMVYRRTLVLAVVCIVLGLLASAVYAERLVRPILDLRRVVQRVAGGDLSARASESRTDELGSLATSVNAMTEALLRRDRIMQSVRFAAQEFLSAADWRTVIQEVLSKIGEASGVSRINVCQSQPDEQGSPVARQKYCWTAPGIEPQPEGGVDPSFELLRALLRRGEIVSLRTRELAGPERQVLEARGLKSIIVVPITVEGAHWGWWVLEDCQSEREWGNAEHDSLRAAADMMGAAIVRQRAQDALLEGKATLEQRVAERTLDLQNEVMAKARALADLAEAQSSLVEMSRMSGMAEVATGVLHNVGNVLNSVNVSCTLVLDRLKQSEVANLAALASMLKAQDGKLAAFLTQDAKGKLIPGYLCSLAPVLAEEQSLMLAELNSLREKIDHIKEIVAMQQDYARISGVINTLPIAQLVEDALKLNKGALTRHGVSVVRQFEDTAPVATDRHKVLQILLNLIRNAKYACDEAGGLAKLVTLRVFSPQPGWVAVRVSDNGIGIPPENLIKIFSHGFTTRKDGHGFGLHSGALAAKELGGSLRAESAGLGQGAAFTLELPCKR
jgi:signal transduction histidine kinase